MKTCKPPRIVVRIRWSWAHFPGAALMKQHSSCRGRRQIPSLPPLSPLFLLSHLSIPQTQVFFLHKILFSHLSCLQPCSTQNSVFLNIPMQICILVTHTRISYFLMFRPLSQYLNTGNHRYRENSGCQNTRL